MVYLGPHRPLIVGSPARIQTPTNFKKRSVDRAAAAQLNETVVVGEAHAGAEDMACLGGPFHSSYDEQTLTPPWIKKCDEAQSQLVDLDKILQRLDSNELKLERLIGKIDMMISIFQSTPTSSSSSSH